MLLPDPGNKRRRTRRAVGLAGSPLLLALLSLPVAGPADPGPPPPGSRDAEPLQAARPAGEPGGSIPGDLPAQDPSIRWLGEVRAQRRAWEERRKAARESFEARRRGAGPWGSAQHEAWEEEVERRREARRQQREQERELFRSLGPTEPPLRWPERMDHPGGFATAPTPGSPPGDTMVTDGSPPALPQPLAPGVVYPPGPPPRGPYSPQDWDNLWYYRGY
jgi:hypothetical protein